MTLLVILLFVAALVGLLAAGHGGRAFVVTGAGLLVAWAVAGPWSWTVWTLTALVFGAACGLRGFDGAENVADAFGDQGGQVLLVRAQLHRAAEASPLCQRLGMRRSHVLELARRVYVLPERFNPRENVQHRRGFEEAMIVLATEDKVVLR